MNDNGNEKLLLKTCKGDEELDEVLVEHALHDRDHDHLGTIVIMMTLMVTRMMLMTLTLMTISARMTLITLTLMALNSDHSDYDDNNSKDDTHPKDATE